MIGTLCSMAVVAVGSMILEKACAEGGKANAAEYIRMASGASLAVIAVTQVVILVSKVKELG